MARRATSTALSDPRGTPRGVADPLFAVVDVETSGLSVRRHRILQIGLVTVAADGMPVDRWSTLVKLRWPFQRVGPTAVHGIRRRTLRGAPPLAEGLRDLASRVDGLVLTGHNIEFDAGFLERAAARSGLSLAFGQQVCTLRLSRALDPERELSHTLGDVAARYGVTIDRPHDALSDALATAAILPPLLDAHGVRLGGSAHDIRSALVELEDALAAAAAERRRLWQQQHADAPIGHRGLSADET